MAHLRSLQITEILLTTQIVKHLIKIKPSPCCLHQSPNQIYKTNKKFKRTTWQTEPSIHEMVSLC
jgi:hypothetical protein